ncbi:MAG: manganese catalase family protein, partial [Rhodospirillales bacterium]|nr:manganese catalase family protein [Acetobacter sp.]
HIEMLSTAVALNLEKAPVSLQEEMSKDSVAGAVLNGMDMRHVLSTGLSAYPGNANGVPFNMSHIYASGNIAADMYCNVAAESTGRVLACRLYEATDDPGMKHMLAFNIARDTMHQQQWLAVLEELGPSHLPVPNSFPQSQENGDFAYNFMISDVNGIGTQADQAWTSGKAPDGHGQFSMFINKPIEDAGAPDLGFGRSDTYGQKEQSDGNGAGLLSKGRKLVDQLSHSGR